MMWSTIKCRKMLEEWKLTSTCCLKLGLVVHPPNFFRVSFPYMQFPPQVPLPQVAPWWNLYFLKSLCPITPLEVPLLRNTVRCLKCCGNTLSPGRAGVELVDSTIWWETGSLAFFTHELQRMFWGQGEWQLNCVEFPFPHCSSGEGLGLRRCYSRAVRVPKEPWAGHWVCAVAQGMATGKIQRLQIPPGVPQRECAVLIHWVKAGCYLGSAFITIATGQIGCFSCSQQPINGSYSRKLSSKGQICLNGESKQTKGCTAENMFQ